MAKVKLLLTVLIVLSSLISKAQIAEYRGDPDTSYFTARDLAFNGKTDIARDTLIKVLAKYPEYTDVRVLLAKTYSWDHKFEEARLQFNIITSKEKKNKEVWIGAIKNEQYAKNYVIGLGLANKALTYLPRDTEIALLKEDIILQIKEKQLLQNIIKETKIEDTNTQSITLYSQAEVFESQLDPMFYGTLEYKKEYDWGILVPRVNLNRRFNINGLQAEMDVYPKFNKTLSGYFNYGYSTAAIFPKHRIGGELAKELPKALEVSLGFRHLIFENDAATILTGTFGLYRGNYYVVVRPYVVPDSKKGLSVSGNLLVRRYLKDGYNFLGLNMAYGFDTELNQFIVDGELLAETLLYLESQKIRLEYQFTNNKGHQQYMVNLGLNRQELAYDSGNFILSITAGIVYQIKFK